MHCVLNACFENSLVHAHTPHGIGTKTSKMSSLVVLIILHHSSLTNIMLKSLLKHRREWCHLVWQKSQRTFGFSYFWSNAKTLSVAFGWIRDLLASNKKNSKHAVMTTALMTLAYQKAEGRERKTEKGMLGAILNAKRRHSLDEIQYPKVGKIEELERCGRRTQTRHIDYKRVSP